RACPSRSRWWAWAASSLGPTRWPRWPPARSWCSATPGWSTAARSWWPNAWRRCAGARKPPAAAPPTHDPAGMTALYQLVRDADLTRRNTFGVPARAPWLLQVNDSTTLPDALVLDQLRGLPLLPLGGGSNLLFAGDAPGAVLGMGGRRAELPHDDGGRGRVRAEAGAEWHGLVMWSVEQGLRGLENLALIPGSVGAAPIQNIGAYGVEVGEHIAAVEAWDQQAGGWVRLDRTACAFGYRDSAFKRQPGRWIVAAVEFELLRTAA